jgi:hypothetical protein
MLNEIHRHFTRAATRAGHVGSSPSPYGRDWWKRKKPSVSYAALTRRRRS